MALFALWPRRALPLGLAMLVGGLGASACAGAEAPQNEPSALETATPSAMPPSALAQDAEMLPLAAPGRDTEASLPTDRPSLLLEVDKAVSASRLEEALSILDTLLVLEPADAELLERRAAVLLIAGRAEDAALDRQRCCALGRSSCC